MNLKRRKYIKFKHAIAIAGFLFLITSVQGQNGQMSDKTSEEKAQIMTDKQKEKIAFYETQEQDMYDINLKYVKEMEVIAQGGRSMDTIRKLRAMSDRKDKEVKGILDKEQYKIYLKSKEDMRSQMRARRGSGSGRFN